MDKQSNGFVLNEGLYNASASARKRYGADTETDPLFAPLATERPKSLLPRVLRLANSEGDSEVNQILRANGLEDDGDGRPRTVVFTVGGEEVRTEIKRRGKNWTISI